MKVVTIILSGIDLRGFRMYIGTILSSKNIGNSENY
jgi:hypothetical protein